MPGSAPREILRAAAACMVICGVSWLGLVIGAGNTGLQRSISKGPLTLLEQPTALVLAGVLAFVAAYLLATTSRSVRPRRVLIVVLLGDLVGAVVLAPLAVGELTPLHAPLVFVPLTALGIQPLAAVAGTWLCRRLTRRAVPV